MAYKTSSEGKAKRISAGKPDKQASKKGTLKEWTVMVYMAGDNNLNEECIWAVSEMEKVKLKKSVALTVQFDTKGNKAVRRDLSRGAKAERRRIDFVPSHRKIGSFGRSPWQALKAFVKDTVEKYEANKYLLVLSGHGSGAVGDLFLKQDNPPSFLSVPFLGAVLSTELKEIVGNRKIDILGLDACGMNMVEVGLRINESVDYLVGAEGVEPNTGWPYFEVLNFLNDNPTISPEEFACNLVPIYTNYYKPYQDAQMSVNFSACRLSKGESLKDAVNNLAILLKKEIQKDAVRDAIILAHWRAQSFLFENYVDLWDFCDLLENGCKHKRIQEACRLVKRVVSNEADQYGGKFGDEYEQEKYVMKSCYSGAVFQHSHGTSIYFPWVRDDGALKRYGILAFAHEPQWKEFLEIYVDITQRQPRGEAAAEQGELGGSPTKPINEDPSSGDVRVSQEVAKVSDDETPQSEDFKFNDSNFKVSQEVAKGLNFLIPKIKNPPTRYVNPECECRIKK